MQIEMNESSTTQLLASSSETNSRVSVNTDAPPVSLSKWYLVILVLFLLFADYTLMTIIIPIVSSIFPDASVTEISFLFAIKPIVQIISNPFVALIIDNYNCHRTALFFGTIVLAVSTVGWGLSSEYTDLLFTRGAQGLGSTCIMAAGMSLIALRFENGNNRGLAMGIAQIGVALGVIIGPTLGGFLFFLYGAKVPFLAIGSILGFSLILQPVEWYLSRNESTAIGGTSPNRTPIRRRSLSEDREETRSSVFQDRWVLLTALCILACNFYISTLEPLVPHILSKEPFHFQSDTIGYVWSASTAGYLVGTPLAGTLSDGTIDKWILIIIRDLFRYHYIFKFFKRIQRKNCYKYII